ncbi:DDE superfamily endonuclease-domain-containing protein [Xylaria cubensis]|nr:DDE superfamily endonuclease-domain-containing protein [Xylaria cubensis]
MTPAPTPVREALRPGPKPKGLKDRTYRTPKPIRRVERTYSKRRKVEVLLFLDNHRIPITQTTRDGDVMPPNTSRTLVGAFSVEKGYRRPYLKEVAEYFKISSHSTIQYWWSQREKILGHHHKKRTPRWPATEAILWEEFCTRRKAGKLVSRGWFRKRSMAIFEALHPGVRDIFVFSNGWFRGFLSRHQISRRRLTHTATKVPDEIVHYTNAFLQYVRRNSRDDHCFQSTALMSDPVEGISFRRFSNHLIVNMDETPLPFEFLDGYTYDHKGTKSVNGRSDRSGWGKRQATLVLAILADGSYVEELIPLLIFHGKGKVFDEESPAYHPGVCVKFNETAYNNEELFEEWIKERLLVYTAGRESLLVMDSAAFHLTEQIRKVLKAGNMTSAIIPAGLTGYLQPLDVSFNGPFKVWLREETDLYLEELDHLGQLPESWTIGQRRVMATHVVGNAWKRAFTPENKALVAKSFVVTGISIHPDGRDDCLISIKGIKPEDLRLDEWYTIPEFRDQMAVIASPPTALDELQYYEIAGEGLGMPQNNYRSLTNAYLRELLRQRGLKRAGNKLDMVKRLEASDEQIRARGIPTATKNALQNEQALLQFASQGSMAASNSASCSAATDATQFVWESEQQFMEPSSPRAYEFEFDVLEDY